ncbi:MAG: hypothetical protein P8Y20_09370 [Gammaproteobacteria bacterium]|jgi:hypothetical protein
MNSKTLEDIERAAWFARLAFGVYQENMKSPPMPKTVEVKFNVLP